MLKSQELQRRQSEVREELSTLAGNDTLTDEQRSTMTALDGEYRDNEAKYRAALIAEDSERRDASDTLQTREGSQWADLVNKYELRQAALYLDEGKVLDGATAEVVQELRNAGGYRGVPIPFEALETRAGETIASGVPDPVSTRPIIDRLFPGSVAGSMGARMINVSSGAVEYPVSTSAVTAGWQSSETGDVAGPTKYTTIDRPLKPNQTLGVQMKVTRRSLLQAGGIEEAIRRDMRSAIAAEMDKAVFQGTGASGQPLGVIAGASTYGIDSTAVDAAATWAAFRSAVTEFLIANAAASPGSVRVLIRPEVWDGMDGAIFDAGSGITEFDRFSSNVGSIVQSSNALAAPADTVGSNALLTTNAGGQSPVFVATWGAVDMIRDPYSDAASGGLRLTGLVTLDVTISRAEQLRVLTGLQ